MNPYDLNETAKRLQKMGILKDSEDGLYNLNVVAKRNNALVAQLVEHRTRNTDVAGSMPVMGSKNDQD
jgi:hypothetical protein